MFLDSIFHLEIYKSIVIKLPWFFIVISAEAEKTLSETQGKNFSISPRFN